VFPLKVTKKTNPLVLLAAGLCLASPTYAVAEIRKLPSRAKSIAAA
jgi:hypothetical protein